MTPENIATMVSRLPFTLLPSDDPEKSPRMFTCPVRLAFSTIAEPKMTNKSDKNGQPFYKSSVCAIVPAAADLSILKAEIARVGKLRFGDRFAKPEIIKPLKPQQPKADKYQGFAADGYYFDASTRLDVDVRDTRGVKISGERIYSGCWARLVIGCWTYPTPGAKPIPGGKSGVGINLFAVQFLADDEKFSGSGASAGDAFGDIDDIVSAVATTAVVDEWAA